MAFKYAEAYVELAWKKDQYDAGEQQVQASIRTIVQQTADMAAKVQAATKSTSADVYELKDGFYKLSETVADVPKPLAQVEQRTLATGAAMKNLGGVVGLVSPQMGAMISIAGQLQARMGVLSQANGATATAATRLGTAFAGLSTTVLAFMGTPVGLMITGFTAVVGLLASARKEGESLGDTLLRLTDIVHGLASAQERANKAKDRDLELSKMLFKEERSRQQERKDPAVAAAEAAMSEPRQELRVEQQRLSVAERNIKNLKDILTLEPDLGGDTQRALKKAEEDARSIRASIKGIQTRLNQMQAELLAPAQEQARLNALASILPFDPSKSAAANRRESEDKMRRREAEENRERSAANKRRESAQEPAPVLDEEKAASAARRNRRALRGMGLDQAGRENLGMAAAMGGVGDILRALTAGMERPQQTPQRFGFTGAAEFASLIQQGIQNREERELLKKQTQDIGDIAEGKKAIKVEVLKAPPQVAVFGR